MSNNVEKMSKNVEEIWQKLFQHLENNLTLIRATVDDLIHTYIHIHIHIYIYVYIYTYVMITPLLLVTVYDSM